MNRSPSPRPSTDGGKRRERPLIRLRRSSRTRCWRTILRNYGSGRCLRARRRSDTTKILLAAAASGLGVLWTVLVTVQHFHLASDRRSHSSLSPLPARPRKISAEVTDERLRRRFNLSSLLLPVPLELQRRGFPLSSVYDAPEPTFSVVPDRCSCDVPFAPPECCARTIVKSHKMGVMLVSKLFRIHHRRVSEIAAVWGARWNVDRIPTQGDFRDVLVLRNLYASLVSGYLYHKSGRECWLDPDGNPGHKPREPFEVQWDAYLSYPLPIPRHNRSLCRYLADESPDAGLQAYVGWVFGVHYRKTLAHLALSRELPVLRNRTIVACYENLTSDPVAASDVILSFLLNRPPPFPRAFGSALDAGGHATNSTLEDRESLMREIRRLDHMLYKGDLEFVNSLIPCG